MLQLWASFYSRIRDFRQPISCYFFILNLLYISFFFNLRLKSITVRNRPYLAWPNAAMTTFDESKFTQAKITLN